MLSMSIGLHGLPEGDSWQRHPQSTYSDMLKDQCLWMQPFNVLRYQLGQHYDSHYDIFEPESYGPQSSQRVR